MSKGARPGGELLSGRASQDRKRREDELEQERRRSLERARLSRQAREAVRTGGREGLRRWAQDQGVELALEEPGGQVVGVPIEGRGGLAFGRPGKTARGRGFEGWRAAVVSTARVALAEHERAMRKARAQEEARGGDPQAPLAEEEPAERPRRRILAGRGKPG